MLDKDLPIAGYGEVGTGLEVMPLVGRSAPTRPIHEHLRAHMIAQAEAFAAGQVESRPLPDSVPRVEPAGRIAHA